MKNRFIGKDLDAGKDWRQEEEWMTEDEMVEQHHLLYGPTFTSVYDYWKSIALTIWTFVGKVMSLLFNTLSSFVKTEQLHFDFSLSCIGEGNGNPLQYSCLENPRDGGAWWAAVYGVTQSQTRLKLLSSSKVCHSFVP